ncbi:MAG TPA: MEDS domain-containing protein, partial [Thermoanaerobaculia bacterium]|nr:MEDS domain-containing protein [Thermoanaerobaculia bacterium]
MTHLQSEVAAPRHAVQFYEREEFLYDVVVAFLAAGLDAGEPAIVVCTPAHREGFLSLLRERGTCVDRLTLLDAQEMLSTFMVRGVPDGELFQQNVGLRVKAAAAESASIRVYGEMVDVLWRDDQTEAALRLEELWNALAEQCSFSLLCAYRMGSFLRDICVRHDHVLDSEEVAGRKQLENALREALAARRAAEEELRDFIQHATVGLHCVGSDGTILWANDAELQLLGYAADEYVGRSVSEFHADAPVIQDILRRLSAREEIRDYEARLVAKDGSIRHVAISSNAKFENDRFVHTRCFTRDITDSKRLEEERRRADEANAFLLEATTILHGSLDYEARLREVTALAVPRLGDWCAVDLASEDGSYERAALAHFDPERLEAANRIVRAYPLPRRDDPIIEVLRTGQPRIIQLTDNYLASIAVDEIHLRDAKGLGLCSSMIVPMTHNDRVLGTISFVNGVSGRRYTESDLPLAMEFARRAAIAIDNA